VIGVIISAHENERLIEPELGLGNHFWVELSVVGPLCKAIFQAGRNGLTRIKLFRNVRPYRIHFPGLADHFLYPGKQFFFRATQNTRGGGGQSACDCLDFLCMNQSPCFEKPDVRAERSLNHNKLNASAMYIKKFYG
jgi:hypothetical protein